MSYFIRIFCKSSERVIRREIADFILDGSFFDDAALSFDPPLNSPELDENDWKLFVIQYDSARRPITLEHNTGDQVKDEEIDELLFILSRSRESKMRDRIMRHLKETVQVFAIEVNPDDLAKMCWEMLDALEAYLAQKLEGLVYAPDEGFYDKTLKHIYTL